jgi:periplasmic divalent cation tolerance protein
MPKPLVVYCTVPDAKTGGTIARSLVKEGLCACVNRLPAVTSYYIYEGEFCEESEELLIIKSDEAHFRALERRIRELNPYDVPEIIASQIVEGSDAYLKWLGDSLKPL